MSESHAPAAEEAVRSIARAVAVRGGRAWLVGGCVRDVLLGGPRKDWDLEVYGVAPADLRALLEREHEVVDVGRSFGVLKLTLSSDRYQWEFVPIAGAGATDGGSGVCH